MDKIINFNEKLKSRQEQEEINKSKSFFETFIKPYLTESDKQALLQAIQNNDKQAIETITEPIIMKQLIREFN